VARVIACALALVLPDMATGGIAVVERLKPRIHFLLVAASEVSHRPSMPGTLADIKIIESALRLRQTPDSMTGTISRLSGPDATRANILGELDRLRAAAGPGEVVALYWAGASEADAGTDDVLLLAFDAFEADVARPSRALSLARDIVPLSSKRNPLTVIADGCHVGDALAGALSRQYPYFVALSSTKADEVAFDTPEGSAFAHGVADALRGEAADLDLDGFISAEELHHFVYPRVVEWGRLSGAVVQHPTVAGRSAHRVLLARYVPPGERIEIDDAALLSAGLAGRQITAINGTTVSDTRVEEQTKTLLLSEDAKPLLSSGVNVLQTAAQSFVVWREQGKLQRFKQPYGKSRAVIVAIDDYERKNDPKRRGPTGLAGLGQMVPIARSLSATLIKLGFDDVKTLFDAEAESANVEDLLKQFWDGGKYSDTDRLFVFFAGHGIKRDEGAWFATYDYQPERAKLTTVSMRDLTLRHAANFSAKHVFMAIDACHAGLALGHVLAEPARPKPDGEFAALSVIATDTSRKTRNVFVAGTEDEEAVYINGGIFSSALVAALNGDADSDRDNVIRLEELEAAVRMDVIKEARQTGRSQAPSMHRLTDLGEGRMVFLLRGFNRKD